jgi:hypothetical protein
MAKLSLIVNHRRLSMEKLVDYADHMITTERLLKDIKEALLRRKYDEALHMSLLGIAELKMAYNAIKHYQELDKRLSP